MLIYKWLLYFRSEWHVFAWGMLPLQRVFVFEASALWPHGLYFSRSIHVREPQQTSTATTATTTTLTTATAACDTNTCTLNPLKKWPVSVGFTEKRTEAPTEKSRVSVSFISVSFEKPTETSRLQGEGPKNRLANYSWRFTTRRNSSWNRVSGIKNSFLHVRIIQHTTYIENPINRIVGPSLFHDWLPYLWEEYNG